MVKDNKKCPPNSKSVQDEIAEMQYLDPVNQGTASNPFNKDYNVYLNNTKKKK